MVQSKADSKGGGVILITLMVAMLLDIMPLPEMIELFRPEWVVMVLIYWVMALPSRIGVFSGWFLGLFVDVLKGSLFGINALSFALVVFLIQVLYHRLRLFPQWKQALNITVIIGLHRLLVVNLTGLVEPVSSDFTYWLPLICIAVLWPWLFILLRDIRRKFC
ncbi:rod shape-determining protein MreD [Aliikangiella sp. IMCC44359]|uniref:rod shape-determining protein MreD n=1 Tax=Aliikangiella sp. IMCC44359 TaxID=3459125 RepID=UPI00403A82BE